jgi:hypothetical protein
LGIIFAFSVNIFENPLKDLAENKQIDNLVHKIEYRNKEMIKMAGWVLYMMWAVLGFMMLDFLVGLFRSVVTKSFSSKMVLDYLKDILYYVVPLLFLLSLIPIDPTKWVLLIFFYIGGLAVIWNYLKGIIKKWRA